MCKALLLAVTASVAVGCASSSTVTSFESSADLANLNKDERRFWAMADDADASLQRSGLLFGDATLDAYLKGILDSLYPQFSTVTEIHVIRSAEANAFAMTNGSIYINTGMLARLENEAELAAILGHEGAHFTERHVIQNVRRAKDMSVFANVVGLATGVGGALASSLVAASSMSGLSQSLESEADVRGLEQMRAAGYDTSLAARPFRRLAEELEARDIQEPLLFRSHPKLNARADTLEEIASDVSDGERFTERYLDVTLAARLDALRTAARAKRHDSLIYLLADDARLANFPPQTRFYLAEAYRSRNEDGDREAANRIYRGLIDDLPEYAPPYARLGRFEMQEGNDVEAIQLFDRYLELAPMAKDSAYIRRYRDKLSEGNPK